MDNDSWAAKAAEHIVDEVSEDVEWRNRRLVKPTAERIAAIVADHSPFKEDVAYMPVPRCDQCHWWNHVNAGRGECGLVLEVTMLVPGNFGCVRWTEKIKIVDQTATSVHYVCNKCQYEWGGTPGIATAACPSCENRGNNRLIGSREGKHDDAVLQAFIASTPLEPKAGFWHLWTELVYAIECGSEDDAAWYARRLYRMAENNGLAGTQAP